MKVSHPYENESYKKNNTWDADDRDDTNQVSGMKTM